MFLVIGLVLLLALSSPWNVVAAIVCGALFVLEIGVLAAPRGRARRCRRAPRHLVGATGEVTEPLAPVGQIRVQGELWEARAATELPRGTRVRVVAIDGLTLEVEPDDIVAEQSPLRRRAHRGGDPGASRSDVLRARRDALAARRARPRGRLVSPPEVLRRPAHELGLAARPGCADRRRRPPGGRARPRPGVDHPAAARHDHRLGASARLLPDAPGHRQSGGARRGDHRPGTGGLRVVR